jgi:hypothetical protein
MSASICPNLQGAPYGHPLTHLVRRLLLLGAGAYAVWIVSVWLRPDIDPVTSYVSELSARDQSWSLLFRASDAVAGQPIAAAAMLVLARGSWRLHPRQVGWLWPLGWAALAAFGVATVLVALTPMACAVTQDEGCAVLESEGELPLQHTLHTVTSTVANAALLIATLALAGLMARRRPLVAWVGWLLVTTIVIGTVRTLVEIAGQHIALSGPDLLGLAQRLTLSAAALFIAWVALDLPAAAPRPRMPRTSSS